MTVLCVRFDEHRPQTSGPLRREAVVAGEAHGALRRRGGSRHGHDRPCSVLGDVSLCPKL